MEHPAVAEARAKAASQQQAARGGVSPAAAAAVSAEAHATHVPDEPVGETKVPAKKVPVKKARRR